MNNREKEREEELQVGGFDHPDGCDCTECGGPICSRCDDTGVTYDDQYCDCEVGSALEREERPE